MEPFAEPADITDVWRPLTTAQAEIAEGLIAQASALLRRDAPQVDAVIARDTTGLKLELAKAAVVNAVKRVLPNLDGLLSEQIDDYSFRRDAATSTGELYIAAGDLVGLSLRRVRKFGMINLRATI